jgi:uncharacterized membrane protein YdfJ with MMPL/SSD domain
MFMWWSRTVVRFRWLVVIAALLVASVGVGWGAGVFGSLTSGGFDDPKSESVRAAERATAALGHREVDVVLLYSGAATVDDPEFRGHVQAAVAELRQRPEVASVVSYYDTQAASLVSRDRDATFVAVTLAAADEDGKQEAYEALRPDLEAPGVTTQVGGTVAFQATVDELTERDLARGEMLAVPIVLVLLVLIFRGVVAAAMPLLVGGLAVLGALTATRLISGLTDVSTFAVNTIILLGLGMAIDYSLLIISRFREELATGAETHHAIQRTMTSAGRTVLVSGLTIALALASLLVFPQTFLRSMGIGGMAAVSVAMLGALTVLPAVLAILGLRVNALRIPVPRRLRGRSATGAQRGAFWSRLSHSVMRRPWPYLAGVIGLLALLAQPLLHAQFGGADERVMPADSEPRVVAERLAADFPGRTSAPIEALVEGASQAELQRLTDQLRALPDVTGAELTEVRGASALISVSYAGSRTGDQAYGVVDAIRELTPPPGVEMLVGGRPALDVDRLDSLRDRLPWAVLLMASSTLGLLFFAFGSVVLPIKAVLMSLISLGASFGVVVWIFQDGHLSNLLGFTPTGFIEPTIPILLFVIVFGLSTDYEVFLLSRVREAWDQTRDNTAAVAAGMQHTGGIITAAALLLITVVAGFTTGQITFAKMIGVGMITAIVVDATLVRMLLVPATMRLLGRWNWWAPAPLANLYRRFGIREQPSAAPAPTSPRAPTPASR